MLSISITAEGEQLSGKPTGAARYMIISRFNEVYQDMNGYKFSSRTMGEESVLLKETVHFSRGGVTFFKQSVT